LFELNLAFTKLHIIGGQQIFFFFFFFLASQPSLGLGLLLNLLPLKMAEFLGGFSTVFFFTG
jgi:hypothetical protein